MRWAWWARTSLLSAAGPKHADASVISDLRFTLKAMSARALCMYTLGGLRIPAARPLHPSCKLVLHVGLGLLVRVRERADCTCVCPRSLASRAQVYNAVREWRRLRPAADEAVVQLKAQARRQAREDKARKAQVRGCE